jgi:uncharacterized membrane protein YkvA (DUF1232 family)
MFEKALKHIKLLPKLIGVFGYAYAHPDVSIYLKSCAVAGIVYFFSPLDLIPDIFTPIGFVDDIILSLMIMQKFIQMIPADTMQPILSRFGITRSELMFDVEAAVKETYVAGHAIFSAIVEGFDAIIEYYSKKRSAELEKVTQAAPPSAVAAEAVEAELRDGAVDAEAGADI